MIKSCLHHGTNDSRHHAGQSDSGGATLYAVLQKLPDDCIVYYEPRIDSRHPDFVLILPEFGVLIIEVKGWFPVNVIRGNQHKLCIRRNGVEMEEKHPLRQARDYMFTLKDYCSTHRAVAGELFNPQSNKFRVRLEHCCILSNTSLAQFSKRNFLSVFPPKQCLTSDHLEERGKLDSEELMTELRQFFPKKWKLRHLNEMQITRLRTIIHPEILIESPSEDEIQEEDC
jgi:hypothetical protein